MKIFFNFITITMLCFLFPLAIAMVVIFGEQNDTRIAWTITEKTIISTSCFLFMSLSALLILWKKTKFDKAEATKKKYNYDFSFKQGYITIIIAILMNIVMIGIFNFEPTITNILLFFLLFYVLQYDIVYFYKTKKFNKDFYKKFGYWPGDDIYLEKINYILDNIEKLNNTRLEHKKNNILKTIHKELLEEIIDSPKIMNLVVACKELEKTGYKEDYSNEVHEIILHTIENYIILLNTNNKSPEEIERFNELTKDVCAINFLMPKIFNKNKEFKAYIDEKFGEYAKKYKEILSNIEKSAKNN